MTRRILVIDSIRTGRAALTMRLAAGCYSATFADDLDAARVLMRREKPDVVLLDMPDACPAIIELRRRHRDLPLLAFVSEAEERLAVLQAGALDTLTRPADEGLLLARLRAALRRHAEREEAQPQGLAEDAVGFERPATIAFVTDRGDSSTRLRDDLAAHRPDRLSRITREDALAARQVPDIFVIESGLGGAAGGLRLMSDLRAQAETRHVPVCILDSGPTAETAAMAWDLGADEVVPARIGAPELALRLAILLRMKQRQDRHRASVAQGLRMAMVDPLTGLHNRRFAQPRLESMAHGELAILIIDLDHFKSVNDRWGHATGDAVLRTVAQRLTEHLPPGALAARVGGEEFLLALPDMQLAGAIQAADDLCHRIAATPIALPTGEELSVTVSIGLATRGRHCAEAVADTAERADRALLQSKRAGRNRVTVASSQPEWGMRSA